MPGFDPTSIISEGANQIIGAGMGMLLSGFNDNRQYEQAQRLQELQIQGSKELTDYNTAKQLQFWKDTNYPEQVKQLKAAGLNPALLYGKGGQGGTTGAIAGNVQGQQAPQGGNEIIAEQGMAMQLAMQKAQIENINADTEVKKSTVPKTEAETQSLLQGVENQKAQEILTKVQTELTTAQAQVAKGTMNEAASIINLTASKMTEEISILRAQKMVDQATVDEKINLVRRELINARLQSELTKAGITKTEQETKEIANQINLVWKQLQNETNKTEIQKKLQEFETSFGGQASHLLQTLVGAARMK